MANAVDSGQRSGVQHARCYRGKKREPATYRPSRPLEFYSRVIEKIKLPPGKVPTPLPVFLSLATVACTTLLTVPPKVNCPVAVHVAALDNVNLPETAPAPPDEAAQLPLSPPDDDTLSVHLTQYDE
jgi:hypothetical protein